MSELAAPTAFFEVDGDTAVPSELTRGPWDHGSQHAGPPAALLGRALERIACPDGRAMRFGRVTYEVLRPVPIAPLRTEVRIERDGRRVQMLAGSLWTGEDEVMRVRGWRLAEAAVDLPPGLLPGPPEHSPAQGSPEPFFPTGAAAGFHTAVEYRFVAGSFLEPGPATVWMRTTVPLVAGEGVSPLQRVLIVADAGNGVSAALDWRRFLFINLDLTVHLHRYPVGEWVCLDAVTLPEPDGVGLADTRLYDERGAVGRGAQTLLVAER